MYGRNGNIASNEDTFCIVQRDRVVLDNVL